MRTTLVSPDENSVPVVCSQFNTNPAPMAKLYIIKIRNSNGLMGEEFNQQPFSYFSDITIDNRYASGHHKTIDRVNK